MAAALVTYIVDMPELLPSPDSLASPSKWGRITSLVGNIKETAIAFEDPKQSLQRRRVPGSLPAQ